MAYKYSVVSFLPDIIASEYVNIGIELHDMDTRVLYKKYTKNVKEINRRYAYGHKGVEKMHEVFFSGFINSPEIVQDKEYLNKEHSKERGTYNRIFYREPYAGINDPKEALEHLYDMFIIIDKKDDK